MWKLVVASTIISAGCADIVENSIQDLDGGGQAHPIWYEQVDDSTDAGIDDRFEGERTEDPQGIYNEGGQTCTIVRHTEETPDGTIVITDTEWCVPSEGGGGEPPEGGPGGGGGEGGPGDDGPGGGVSEGGEEPVPLGNAAMLTRCVMACDDGVKAIRRFCRSVDWRIKAGCWALQWVGNVACRNWCYWQYGD